MLKDSAWLITLLPTLQCTRIYPGASDQELCFSGRRIRWQDPRADRHEVLKETGEPAQRSHPGQPLKSTKMQFVGFIFILRLSSLCVSIATKQIKQSKSNKYIFVTQNLYENINV